VIRRLPQHVNDAGDHDRLRGKGPSRSFADLPHPTATIQRIAIECPQQTSDRNWRQLYAKNLYDICCVYKEWLIISSMAREFGPFDETAIEDELDALEKASISDLAKLDFCMRRYEEVDPKENPSPALIRSFEKGFLELRHMKGDYKGRLLFYARKFSHGDWAIGDAGGLP
jgi:hypothetical protein